MMRAESIIADLPKEDQKFMVIFSDGEDLNSKLQKERCCPSCREIDKFQLPIAIDYMDKPALDGFLQSFSEKNNGVIPES